MITGSANAGIKSVRKLREKKFRAETGLASIEGLKLVINAIEQGARIEKLVISESFEKSGKKSILVSRIENLDLEELLVSDEVFSTLSTKENPKGIIAVIHQKWLPFESFINQSSGLWVGLWEVADPGNLGSIMRTVDAVGGRGIILMGNCTDPYDPGAIRGSMGAIFSNLLVKSDVFDFANWVKSRDITAIGTSDAALTHYREVIYPKDMILLMGSERQGLPVEISNACRDLVRIPMRGISDSLNLAVATGIMLYEIYEQNNQEGKR